MGTELAKRVYVVEDDDELRRWLGRELGHHGFQVRTYATIGEFEKAIESAPPGCVLADLRMPGGGAMELLKQAPSPWVKFPVIVMSAFADVAIAVSAMKLGAVDFIEKPFTGEAIVQLLRLVHMRLYGERGFGNTGALGDIARERLQRLTPRELDVLNSIVTGHPNKVIADELGLSTRTVEVYRARVLKKMQVRGVAQLVSLALAAAPENRLVSLEHAGH